MISFFFSFKTWSKIKILQGNHEKIRINEKIGKLYKSVLNHIICLLYILFIYLLLSKN